MRNAFGVVVLALAAWALINKRHQLASASHLIAHVDWRWMVLAIGAEVSSMVIFARLQRWLLRAGGVRIGLLSMVELTLAGNAMDTTLPGGVAWSAAWAFGQLRRRGADRILSGWVILVAGALSSFAIFVLLAVGAWVAGSKGPVASLRPLAVGLAAIPVAVAVLGLLLARWPALRARVRTLLKIAGRRQRMKAVEGAFERFWARVRTVRLTRVGWLEAFGLALANWAMDAVVLSACMLALGVGVPWRGVLVAYALTQVAASLPITPGGLGVVEGSLTALLVAYGMHLDQAVAVTLLYRVVSFWALAPIGWTVWSAIELSQRRGVRTRSHPWAVHLHGKAPPSSDINRQGPGRVIPPRACQGCDEEYEDRRGTDDRPAA